MNGRKFLAELSTGEMVAVGIVFLMVFQPGWILSLVANAISLLLSIASGQVWGRSGGSEEIKITSG